MRPGGCRAAGGVCGAVSGCRASFHCSHSRKSFARISSVDDVPWILSLLPLSAHASTAVSMHHLRQHAQAAQGWVPCRCWLQEARLRCLRGAGLALQRSRRQRLRQGDCQVPENQQVPCRLRPATSDPATSDPATKCSRPNPSQRSGYRHLHRARRFSRQLLFRRPVGNATPPACSSRRWP